MQSQQEVLTHDQLEKLGNTIVFLAENIIEPNKTKILKLLYLCDELSVQKYGVPFFGFTYYAWQYGPVQKEVFQNLDPTLFCDGGKHQSLLAEFIMYQDRWGNSEIVPTRAFDDGEFSDNDIVVMQELVGKYKSVDAKHLIYVTHRDGSLWHQTVLKEEGLFEKFAKGEQKTSNHTLDFSELLDSESSVAFFAEDADFRNFSNYLKR